MSPSCGKSGFAAETVRVIYIRPCAIPASPPLFPAAAMSSKRARIDEPSAQNSATVELVFEPPSPGLAAAATVIVGRQAALSELDAALLPAGVPVEVWAALVARARPGDAGACASTSFSTPAGAVAAVVAAVLPEPCSRTTRRCARTRSARSSARPRPTRPASRAAPRSCSCSTSRRRARRGVRGRARVPTLPARPTRGAGARASASSRAARPPRRSTRARTRRAPRPRTRCGSPRGSSTRRRRSSRRRRWSRRRAGARGCEALGREVAVEARASARARPGGGGGSTPFRPPSPFFERVLSLTNGAGGVRGHRIRR